MSQSLAAAKKRRANFQEPATNVPGQMQSRSSDSLSAPSGLTLPQVIQVVDKRLIALETFMNQIKTTPTQINMLSTSPSSNESVVPSNIAEIVDEFDKRYNMLAEEIINIKNIVLSLQSYTMEVNKSLLDERVRILSDLEEHS